MPARAAAAAAGRGRYLSRALRGTGSERDALVLGVKSVCAAVGAWTLARYLLPPAVSTFAPFTALVTLQATVYRSVRDCVQYLVAMTVGALLAASLAAVAGIRVWTFALLTLIALCLGRIRRFGQHGTQVAVIGFFAFSSGAGRIDYIGHLVASVAIGALCGLGAHLILAPARHTDHRRQAVADLFDATALLAEDLAGAFDTAGPDAEQVRRRRREGRELAARCHDVRHGIGAEIENGRLNPRRSTAGAVEALPRAREAVAVAEGCLTHLRSMTRALDHALADRETEHLTAPFREGLARLLRTAGRALRETGRASPGEDGDLDELIEGARRELERIRRQARATAETPASVPVVQGALLNDAGRLLADLRRDGPEAAPPPNPHRAVSGPPRARR
ncbi:aromatic acid exporter family protein [Streptomyces sp. NPDC048507]|uniref:FUSC family protein n=1 Tax=Streptomyces sp. NPDC048507 TaxID=3365560 RepID=UPI003718FBBD